MVSLHKQSTNFIYVQVHVHVCTVRIKLLYMSTWYIYMSVMFAHSHEDRDL